MTQAPTIDGMAKHKPRSDKKIEQPEKKATSDRHTNYLMLRIKRGLMYRLKRLASWHDRDTTRHVVRILWEHVLEEEAKLGLPEMTADDVLRIADKNLSREEAESVATSSIIEEARKRKAD